MKRNSRWAPTHIMFYEMNALNGRLALYTCLIGGIALAAAPHLMAHDAPSYPSAKFPDASAWGHNIQRTMRLLATSTPEKRNTVRILFYGQSITEQNWSKLVEDDLRRRFPNANLIVENRVLADFASQMLVKTAETDLYPFQPDLLIFHVYGAHDKYEDIIRRTCERTTAEILMQNDHVAKPADFTEETDPAKLPPAGKHWDAFVNHNWLPSIAKQYGCELCDQRALWKAYLTENKLGPKALAPRWCASQPARRMVHGEVRERLPALRSQVRPSPPKAG